MIQAPKLWELVMNRYDLTDFEWSVIEPLLPNKPRGVPRVDDRRVLNGIMWVLRSGRDLPERYGPYTAAMGTLPFAACETAKTVPVTVFDRRRYHAIRLYACRRGGGFDLGQYPAVRAWLDRVAAEPGHVPMEREGVFGDVGDRVGPLRQGAMNDDEGSIGNS